MSPSKKPASSQKNAFEPSRALYEQANPEHNRYRATPGLTETLVREISAQKHEPDWMLKKRLQAFALYQNKPLPTWGPDLSGLNLDEIVYFVRPDTEEAVTWNKVPEDIKKTFDRLGIPEAEKTALSGVGAQYDCLTEDTLVYTSLGMKAIKNLKIGEKVFSWDEKTNSIVTTTVQAVIHKGVRPVFELQVKGKKIETTYNHPFLALLDQRKPGRQRARYTKQWEYLHNLKKNDIVAIANTIPDHGKSYTFSPVTLKKMVVGRNQARIHYSLDISHTYKKGIFPTASNEDILWLFGFYLGDGYITRAKNRDKMRLHFAIHEKDEKVRQNVRRIIKKYFDYTIITEDEVKISINSTAIALFFKTQGFSGNARTKVIPEWVFTLPKKEKIALIAGYTDADGTVRKKNKDVVITSINQHLLEQTKMLSAYCGFDTARITQFSFKKKGHDVPGTGFRLQITGQNRLLPCVHPLKKKRLLSKLGYYGKHNSLQGTTIRKYCSDSVGFSRIQDIRYIGEKKVYDISVKKYRNFIANGFIVHNSDIIYHNLKKEWESKGVIFENMDVAVQKYPELVKKYFMTQCVPINDHKFVMLHAAVWSGGTFIYVPKNVTIDLPLQAYFRMNAEGGGQFEHTLIIADEGSKLHYIEGCSAPRYNKSALHAGCVEIFVHAGARVRYSSIENWSKNTYNLNTKRALIDADAVIEWVNGNMGSGTTMLYPSSVLRGQGARADSLGIAFAGPGQHQDTGAKAIHAAPNTSSTIVSKSISVNGGINTFRGLIHVTPVAKNTTASMVCDALLIGSKAIANTIPELKIKNEQVNVAHEARVGKIGEQEIFYLQSRGFSEDEAIKLVVSGFISPIVKSLPVEYALELNKLIELEMEGAVG